MRIAVCETQTEYIEYICRLLKQIREVSFATVATYTDPEWMISDVFLRTEAFDIAIISRELGTHNGVYCQRDDQKKCLLPDRFDQREESHFARIL